MALRLYNTLTKRIEPFVPRDPARVTFYTCGPTVYDDAHIGNFRSFLAADVLRRWIESPLCELETVSDRSGARGVHKGPREVAHVMNITDVGHMTDDAEGGERGEDRMAVAGRRLLEAKKAGKLPADAAIDPSNPYDIARFYESRFLEDARKLGLKLALEAEKDPAKGLPRATEHVPGMIEVIQRLMARGNAYVVGAPGSRVVYFRVQSFPGYGRLSGNTLDKLKEGAGGRVSGENQSGKEHPADFLLWKEDPSHIMKWDSPWGAGYPGWHIECTVMSVARLLETERRRDGETKGLDLGGLVVPDGEAIIDVHSGGEDNIFPHHECEIAQSCCAFNETPETGSYARLWFHPRFLLVNGEKMSKSKGNFYTQRDLFARGVEPGALRLELIKTHYRSNANFTDQGLKDSERIIERWRRFAEEGSTSPGLADSATPSASAEGDPGFAAARAFADAMNDDLNVSGAIGAINKWIAETPRATRTGAALMRTFDAVLGVLERERAKATTSEIGVFAPGVDPDPNVIELLELRRTARAAKDFKKSDEIRDRLDAMGYAIKDVAGGKVEVRRK